MRLRLTTLVLALLAALLGSAGEQIRADAPPPPELPRAEPWLTLPAPPPRLALTLESSRELCTAGTLTEISWQISGGSAPYALSVENSAVDVSADNVRVNCGALTEAEAGDAEAALAAKTVTAVVTDSRGVRREAALDVARARALPAPSRSYATAQRTLIAMHWSVNDGVRGTDGIARYLVRSRPTGQAVWNYVHNELLWSHDRTSAGIPGLSEGIAYEAQVAAVRDPLEALTPAALTWSGTTTATTTKAPSGVRATATHDTVTVVWDAQPSVRDYHIRIVERGSQGPGRLKWVDASPTVSREITFRGLDAATNYTVTVSVDGDFYSRAETNMDIATAQAPANWTPSERAPVIVGTRATHNMIEVSWAAPPTDARLMYLVSVEHPASPYPYADWVEGATTFSLDRLEPETTYTIHVHHHDLHGGKTTIEITTLPAPSAERQPLIEWWADGRPTSPPLDLTLESSRELCTAGTLTEISWQISGGSAPYVLSIEDSAVDVSAENLRINCGALTEAEAADAQAGLAARRITAVVTDSRGVRREAALDVARARALPAPTDFDAAAYRTYILSDWTPAGLSGPGVERSSVLRWRPQGSAQWTFAPSSFMSNVWTPSRDGATVDNLSEATVYELSVADTRTAIESETPEALNWTPVQAVTTLTAATNVRATATHDTITVRWDPQSAPDVSYFVSAHSLKGGISEHVSLSSADPHEFTLRGLPPDTEHRVFVRMEAGDQSRITEVPAPVRTLPAPPDWTAPLRGAQNVRATATHNSITVRWDPPRVDATPLYIVFLFRDHDFIEGQEVKVRHVEVFDATAVRLDGLDSSTAYRVVISHGDTVVRDQEVAISTTAAPSSG